MKATDKQQLSYLISNVSPILIAVCDGYDYDPGDSDLDDEQPITVRMTLGEYRRARNLNFELDKS